MDNRTPPDPQDTIAEIEAAVAAPATPHPSLASYNPNRVQIEKVLYTHDAMIDLIIADPRLKSQDLAKYFGYSSSWVSVVTASDAFQARLAQRRTELLDPTILASIEERFRALATRSLEVLQEKLAGPSANIPDALALRAAELGAKALGIGGNAPQRTVIFNANDKLETLSHRLVDMIQGARRGDVIDVNPSSREVTDV